MRHDDLSTTQRYISLTGEGLREAVNLLDNYQKETVKLPEKKLEKPESHDSTDGIMPVFYSKKKETE